MNPNVVISTAQELEPLNEMPTNRLTDIIQKLEDDSEPIIINLDAMLPKGRLGAQVLKTFLIKFKPSVLTLSLRFNTLIPESIDELLNFLTTNDTLRSLYLMGTNIDANLKAKIEAVWRKNLEKHSVDNMGLTYYRRSPLDVPPEPV